jgi:hypothetical protein
VTNPNDPWGQGGYQPPPWPGQQGQPGQQGYGGQSGQGPHGQPQGGPYQQPAQPYGTGPQPTQPYHTGPQPTQPYQSGPQPAQPYGQPYPGPGPQTGPQPAQQYPPTQQYPSQPPPTGGWGPPPEHDQPFYPDYDQGQPPQRRRTGLLAGAMVVVVLLVAGAVTAFFAFQGTAAGAPTPKEAAVNLVNALGKNDMVGLVDGLAPAEADVINDYLNDGLGELKRLEVVKPDTKPEQITGVEFKTEGLVFDEAGEEKVNDHLTITKLTDGKVTISSDWSKVPLTDKFIDKAFPNGRPSSAPETRTYDISDEIAKENGQPIRIATVKVGDEWYPSLFYTVADYALIDAEKQWPAQPVAANGADSPEAAVRGALDAALAVDVKRLIELTPPDEMAALHDVGTLLIEAAEGEGPTEVKVNDLQTALDDVPGGKRVRITKLAMEAEGESFTMEVNGDCIKVEQDGDNEELCGEDLAQMLSELAELGGDELTEEQAAAIGRAAAGYLQAGVVATEVDGKWYVSPARTVGDLSMGFLRKLQPGDLETIIAMASQ